MCELYLYIVSANKNPDRITCSVPFEIDKKEIFFGPCKKTLRETIRGNYLKPKSLTVRPRESIYFVGFNGANSSRIRKIIWAGKISNIMTFESACKKLTKNKYQELKRHDLSPLHVIPVFLDKKLVGYKHVSNLHKENNAWIEDLVKPKDIDKVKLSGNYILIKSEYDFWNVFSRDACILFENIFLSKGRGLDLDDEVMDILKRAQPDKEIDDYAIFGYQSNGYANGLRGSYLHLDGSLADNLISLIKLKGASIGRTLKESQLNNCSC